MSQYTSFAHTASATCYRLVDVSPFAETTCSEYSVDHTIGPSPAIQPEEVAEVGMLVKGGHCFTEIAY